jgi:MSHA biogenesis protein MshI
MVYVAIARKTVVSAQVDKLIDTGFNLCALDIPELSLRNITRLLPEDKQGVALFWLTEESGLLTLTKDSQLYLARKIEIGISHLVNLLREQPTGKDLFEMPNDVTRIVDQIVIEIQRSLDYYESHFNQMPIQHLRFAPFPHTMPGLIEYLTLQLGIDVQWLDLNDIFVMRTPLDKTQQAQYLPMLGAALRKEEDLR